jgi:TonB family protein
MLVLSLLGSAAIAPAEPSPPNPTNKWVVNFADAQCVASRNYGTAEDPLQFVLKAPPMGDVMQIAVMRKGPAWNAHQVRATITLDGAPALKTNMLMYSAPKNKLRAYLLNLPLADFSKVTAAKSFSIRSEGLNETFLLSGMAPLLKVIDTCVAGLRKAWNVEEPGTASSALAERARVNLSSVFTWRDYPDQAQAAYDTGSARFAVLIDETGRVVDCTIIETSGVAVLDAQTCGIVKARAKFKPAIGLDGKPARDAFVQRVNWRLE